MVLIWFYIQNIVCLSNTFCKKNKNLIKKCQPVLSIPGGGFYLAHDDK